MEVLIPKLLAGIGKGVSDVRTMRLRHRSKPPRPDVYPLDLIGSDADASAGRPCLCVPAKLRLTSDIAHYNYDQP